MRVSPRLPLEALAPYLLDVPNPRRLPPNSARLAAAPALSWRTLFGNDHPVEVEVGFGKGLFLLNQARVRPDTNFLGVEIERKYVLLTATRLARAGLGNVKLAATDAHWLLRERVAAGSIAALHVYFPDPWWKKRHRKRKLFTAAFAGQCARVLRPGGRLFFMTDVADYFTETQDMLAKIEALQEQPATEDGEGLTHFERKYRKEGRSIHRALYEKRS